MLKFKLQLAIIYDILATLTAWMLAFALRYNLQFSHTIWPHQALAALPFVLAIQLIANISFGLYRGIWRFASIPDLFQIFKAIFLSTIAIVMLGFFLRNQIVIPRSIPLIYATLWILFTGGARFLTRYIRDHHFSAQHGKRTLIIGAGSAGESVARDLQRTQSSAYTPIALIDDDTKKIGQTIRGLRVRGPIKNLAKIAEKLNAEFILIAVPSASSKAMQAIVEACECAQIPFQTLPKLADIAGGRVDLNSLHNVSVEDLLGRDVVETNKTAITQQLQNKTILITGGGGSIDSELCQQIASTQPAKMVIVDHSEFNLYSIGKQLENTHPNLNFTLCLVDIADQANIENCFIQHRPQIVFHAGAYKHVPLLEEQAAIGVNNNIHGTRLVASLAVSHHVETFVLISTDKAVRPANVMGTTKRIAEMICQSLNDHAETQFITVRFGNVLGSAGSVLPLFKQQVKSGGPVTVTHPEITRYFMTIPEACQLILQASVLGNGGEIFCVGYG